jgi:hypothetical protein
VAFTTWSKDIILFLIAIKTITATKKVLNIINGFEIYISLNLYKKSSWRTYVLVYIKYSFILWESWGHCESFIEAVRYYSMFNCNQNNHSYQKSIKYYLWLQRQQQTNTISIWCLLSNPTFLKLYIPTYK